MSKDRKRRIVVKPVINCENKIIFHIITKISPKSKPGSDSKMRREFDFDSNCLKLERSQVRYDRNEIKICAGENLICSKY